MSKVLLPGLIFLLTFFNAQAQNTLNKVSDDLPFRQGLELIEREKYGAAREFFSRYIDQNKNDLRTVDAEYYVAYCAGNLFNPDAENLYLRFIENHPDHSKVSNAYYDLGTIYYQESKYDKVIEYLSKVDYNSLTAAQKTEADFKLAYAYFSQKDFEKAGPYFDKIKGQKNKYTYAASYYSGYINFKNGNYADALSDLKVAETNDAYKPVVPFLILNVYYKQGVLDTLLDYANQVLNAKTKISNKDDFYLLMGEAYFRKKDYQNAEDFIEKYLSESKSKPTNEIQYRLGVSEYKNGKYEEAIQDFKPLTSLKDSIGASSSYYLGLSYLKNNNKLFALTAFDQARKASQNPEIKKEAFFNYAKITFDLERYNDAIPLLKEYLKEYQGKEHFNEGQDLLSEAFLRTNNYTEAISYIESLKSGRSVRINTTYQRVTFLKGVEDYNNSRYTDAITMFDKSLTVPMEKDITVATYFWKGEAHSILKENVHAYESYAEVFQNDPQGKSPYHLKTRYGIGYAYYNSKEFEKALPHFQIYVNETRNATNKQHYKDALLRLADLYFVTKKYDQAVKHYDEAITEGNPEADYAYFQKGLTQWLNNNPNGARESFQAVTKLYPGSIYYDAAIAQKGEVELGEDMYEGAVESFTKLINERPASRFVPDALNKRAIAYGNLKKHQEAFNDFKTILDKYISHPVSENALYGAQKELAAMNRADEFPPILQAYKNSHPDSEALVNVELQNIESIYKSKQYDKAIASLNQYINDNPTAANIPKAKFLLAESYYQNKDYGQAVGQYKNLINAKYTEFYTTSMQRIADIEFKNKSYEQSKNYYLMMLTTTSSRTETFIAWVGLMESYYNLQKYDSAAYYSNQILSHGDPIATATPKAMLYQGKVYYMQNQYDKAIDQFITTINNAKDENGAEAQYLLAEVLYKQKKYKQSLDKLYDLNKNFYKYGYWLGKSFLLISDNLVATNEIYQAKATLTSVIEKSPQKEIVEEAKIKLAKIEADEKAESEKGKEE